jgi:ParB family chromosome partitioning protein
MAKRKINAAKLMAAGEDAHLQTQEYEEVSHAKLIDGEEFLEINVDSIENNPMQPRIAIDQEELQLLADSISAHGLIHPISVMKTTEGKYILKAGQRRWLAHKLLDKKNIKAIVETVLSSNISDRHLFEIAIAENMQRDNLDPLEFALSLQHAMGKKLYSSMEELGSKLNKSKSYISKALKVLTLEKEILIDLEKNKSTSDIELLYELQKITDSKQQVKVYFDYLDGEITRVGVRELNKKKVSHAKLKYEIKATKKKIVFNADLTGIDDVDKVAIESELKKIIEKYLK